MTRTNLAEPRRWTSKFIEEADKPWFQYARTRKHGFYIKSVIVFISGYTDDALAHHGVLDEGLLFLEKPFSPAQLAQKIREVLDMREAASEASSPKT